MTPAPQSTAYVNGAYVALEEARIPILDRGLLFADSVYEVIPVYAGRCYRLQAHIERLQRSLAGIRLETGRETGDWSGLIETLVERNGGGDLSVYLQVTRGCAAKRDHSLPARPAPGIIAFCQPRAPADPALLEHGIAAITMADTRWRYCSIKSTALLANVLAADEARAAGAAEALLTRDGCVVEGTSSNVFAVIDGCITTPGLRDEILAGITRAAILELAARHGLAHAETPALSLEQMQAAQEIWISSSTREVYPVTELDGARVGNGRPGPVWAHMATLLQKETAD